MRRGFCSRLELSLLISRPTSFPVPIMKDYSVRPGAGEAAMAVARRQVEQLTVVRRRAQPTAVYIARLTATAVFAYLLALQLPGDSSRSVLAPLTALLVVQRRSTTRSAARFSGWS